MNKVRYVHPNFDTYVEIKREKINDEQIRNSRIPTLATTTYQPRINNNPRTRT